MIDVLLMMSSWNLCSSNRNNLIIWSEITQQRMMRIKFERLHYFIIACGIFFLPLLAQAQEEEIPDTIPPEVYLLIFDAESKFDMGQYEQSIVILDHAVNKMDRTLPEIQYLLAKSNMALNRKKQAQKDVYKYLQLQDLDSTTQQYLDMRELVVQLDNELGPLEEERDITGLIGGGFTEQETWDYAVRTNSLQAFRNYLKFYPNGLYSETAKLIIDREEKLREAPSKLLIEAVKRGDMREVRKLIEGGEVDVNFVTTYKITYDRPSGHAYDLHFETPLYMALYKFDYSMAKYLLENGADPNRFTYRKIYDYKEGGRTKSILESLVIATSATGIHAGQDDKLIEFIELMLDHGLDINFYQGSPLATTVYFHDRKNYNRYKLIRYMLRKGADPKLPGWADGQFSALDIARSRNDKKLIQVLKDKRYKKKRKELEREKLEELKELREEIKEAEKLAKQKKKEEEEKKKEEEKLKLEQEKQDEPKP